MKPELISYVDSFQEWVGFIAAILVHMGWRRIREMGDDHDPV